MRNNIRECTTFKEFHNDPEFVFNQEAIVHFDNVWMVIVPHNDNLKKKVAAKHSGQNDHFLAHNKFQILFKFGLKKVDFLKFWRLF